MAYPAWEPCVCGAAYGHHKFEDDSCPDPDNGRMWSKSLRFRSANTIKTPVPSWMKKYPNDCPCGIQSEDCSYHKDAT